MTPVARARLPAAQGAPARSKEASVNRAPGSASKRPPVPAFSLDSTPAKEEACEAWRALREVRLPPPCVEENYEISEKGEDSEAEEPDRTHKRVPEWSRSYLQLLERQMGTDPDTVFGTRVPHVDLDSIFRDEDYRGVRKERPKRRRGSSGEWKQDRLTKQEVAEYKRRMGQLRRWSACASEPARLGA